MSTLQGEWNGEIVRTWLESRFEASLANQKWAKAHGSERDDDFDKAAAEEWVCRMIKSSSATDYQWKFREELEDLLRLDEFRFVGVRNQARFKREVRTLIRKLIRMTNENIGFENTSRFQ